MREVHSIRNDAAYIIKWPSNVSAFCLEAQPALWRLATQKHGRERLCVEGATDSEHQQISHDNCLHA